MRDSRTMLARVRDAAKKLRNASVWRGTGDAIDLLKDDYLYELLCYFNIALAARVNHRIHIAGYMETRPNGDLAAKWPKKPGLKKNFSYLVLENKLDATEIFQLCPGIKIVDKHGKTRAPDVNLFTGNAEVDASHQELLACWDAKHVANEHTRMADTAVSDFIYTHTQLEKPSPPISWSGAVSGTAFTRSGLLTNGDFSTEPDAALLESGIAETRRFPNAAETRPNVEQVTLRTVRPR